MNQIEVAWQPAADAGESEAFYLTTRGPEGEQTIELVLADATSSTIPGLKNGVEYTVTVTAASRYGSSLPSESVTATPTTGMEGVIGGVVVEFEDGAEQAAGETAVPGEERVAEVDLTVAEKIDDERTLVELSDAVDVETAERISSALSTDPDIAWAEPDQFFFTASESVSVPADTDYSTQQWNLWDEYGIGIGDGPDAMTDAWSDSRGEGTTVAVIDTGITTHPDLNGQTVPGYDFVSSPEKLAGIREPGTDPVPFDADYADPETYGAIGRDPNPTDPGDWRATAPVRNSSWHGTQIAGLIAADSNTDGISGVAPAAQVQPIRALSWRGGLLSDIAASITWASGGTVDNVPANATPSDVINLSFAVETVCPRTLQAAIDGAIERGSLVIAAAGNASDDAGNYAPGNCSGVLTVAATNRDGQRADYSNYGPTVDISAPGGENSHDIAITTDAGERTTSTATTGAGRGTSIAAAHVAGVAAVLLSERPELSHNDLWRLLTSNDFTREFRDGVCDPDDPTLSCGAGITKFAQVAVSVASAATNWLAADISSIKGNSAYVGAINGSVYAGISGNYTGEQVNANDGDPNCKSAWRWFHILCDPGQYQNDLNYLYKPSFATGLTVTNSPGSTSGYVVIDLGTTRNFNSLRVFQMFSDGKVTHAEIYAHSNTGSSMPAYNTSGWTRKGSSVVGAGARDPSGCSSPCVGDPTVISFASTSARYVKLIFRNDGRHGNSSYIEVGGVKLFCEASGSSNDCPQLEETQAAGPTTYGSPFVPQPIVTVKGEGGEADTGWTDDITATVRDGSGTTVETATVSPVDGVAEFSGLGASTPAGQVTIEFETDGFSVVSDAITVAKATPTITWPTASNITVGQTLSDSTLSGGESTPNGSFAFSNPTLEPSSGTSNQTVIFTPADTDNYETVQEDIAVTVAKNTQTITFNKPSDVDFGSESQQMTASSDSGLDVTYAADTTQAACDVSTSGLVTIKAAGDCDITANQAGNSQYEAATSVTQTLTITAAEPTQPTITAASAGDQQITVTFTPPGFDGGADITGYEVVAAPTGSGTTVTKNVSTTSPASITGLVNGTEYKVTIAAINSAGTGPASAESTALTPATAATAVKTMSAVPGDTVVDVAWSQPDSLGGGTFVRYDLSFKEATAGSYGTAIAITPTTAGDINTAPLTYQVTGLDNGTSYDFRVVVITEANDVEQEGDPAEVVQYPATEPSAPQAAAVVADTATDVQFSWQTPLSDGGSAIQSYDIQVTSGDGGATSPVTCNFVNDLDRFCTVSGLTNDATYTFTAAATNGIGTGNSVSATYTVPSDDSTLSALSVSDGSGTVSLSPSFVAGTTSYTATVPYSVAEVTVTPTVNEPNATITVDSRAVSSASASQAVGLSVGNTNSIDIVVTAADPAFSTTYTVTITRQSNDSRLSALALETTVGGNAVALSPSFSASRTSYTATVENTVTSVTVTPTAEDTTGATVTVNGGSASTPVNLDLGANTVNVVVTAEDTNFTTTYTITVSRLNIDSSLSNLTVANADGGANIPFTTGFSSGATEYAATVDNSVTSVTVTPTVNDSNASVTVAQRPVTSEQTSDPIFLSEGDNTIELVGIASDPDYTTTYTITITRQSSDATLSELDVTGATGAVSLTPTFASDQTDYTATVDNAVDSVTLTPTTSNAGASVEVDGTAVVSGSSTSQIPLTVGETTIEVAVTAQDPSFSETYTLTITREPAPISPSPIVEPVDPLENPLPLPEGVLSGTDVGVAVEDGEIVPVVLRPTQLSDGWEVIGSGFDMTVQTEDPSGEPLTLSEDQRLRVTQGGRLQVSGGGYTDESAVKVFLVPGVAARSESLGESPSSAIYLGESTVTDQGTFTATFTVPLSIQTGGYVLQINGTSTDEQTRSVNLGIAIEPGPAPLLEGKVQRAGFYTGLSDDFSRNGKRKLRSIVNTVPDDATAVQVLITGVSIGLDGFSENLALAGKRAENLARTLEARGIEGEYLVNVSATYTADGAERSLSGKADVLTTKAGKPLTTVTVLFREPATD